MSNERFFFPACLFFFSSTALRYSTSYHVGKISALFGYRSIHLYPCPKFVRDWFCKLLTGNCGLFSTSQKAFAFYLLAHVFFFFLRAVFLNSFLSLHHSLCICIIYVSLLLFFFTTYHFCLKFFFSFYFLFDAVLKMYCFLLAWKAQFSKLSDSLFNTYMHDPLSFWASLYSVCFRLLNFWSLVFLCNNDFLHFSLNIIQQAQYDGKENFCSLSVFFPLNRLYCPPNPIDATPSPLLYSRFHTRP